MDARSDAFFRQMRLAAAAGDWPRAVRAFRQAVELLPAVAAQELDRGDREQGLADFASLASDAAAAALHCGEAGQAVAALECGRGVLSAQALDLRSTRDQPGFRDFLRPPTAEQVLAQAGAGPVVLLNVSAYRSDALILSGGTIRVQPLPAATPDALQARTVAFLQALAIAGDPGADQDQQEQAEATLLETLEWLWNAIARPVLEVAVPEGSPRARLWWVPTGLLSLLPLHAAGRVSRGGLSGQSVWDRAVSSYAPTVRALGEARQRRSAGQAGPTLVVAVPSAPGAADLPAARAEGETVRTLSPRGDLLAGPAATRDHLLARLPEYASFHFAGHAVGDLLDPSASALFLHDRPVTVGDIARLRLTEADLAFLSACQTATPGVTLIDEAITIASACQLAGFRHVIATLWPVRDQVAASVAGQFWRARPGTGTAAGVHKVAGDLRLRFPDHPSIWAAYVHVGP
jgi:hypothetical protein